MSSEEICGCKGIRTCLVCEKQNDDRVNQEKRKEVRYVYTYCPECNLCWPDNEETAKLYDFPLYIGKIKLYYNFFSEEEETSTVSAIDRIPWMPSQSGRKKQDFGPKVNFKKKKVKIGEFKGFPRFTDDALQKFLDVPELFDFKPVELCHLDYSPDRGSSIDPHVDDFWLWGERLVTINLGSSTVLTLIPCSEDACECFQEATRDFQTRTFCNEHFNRILSGHKSQDNLTINLVKNLSEDKTFSNVNGYNYSENLLRDTGNFVSNASNENCSVPSVSKANSTLEDSPSHLDQLNLETLSLNNPRNSKSNITEEPCFPSAKVVKIGESSATIPNPSDHSNLRTRPVDDRNSFSPIKTMCCAFRNDINEPKVYVRISLPPRSLFVLAGCARYNWFHEIKRQDVVSRRLAMTFRELTAEFLDSGKESEMGKELLKIASTFYDL